MQLRKAIALAALVLFVATACSRLTFVRQSAKRGSAEEVAPTYDVRDSDASKQRRASQNHITRAMQRLQGNDLDAAEKEARAALKLSPGSADPYTLLAAIEDRRGNRPQAGAHYKRAAELAPTKGEALNNYGAWLCANGMQAEALVWFDRALAAPGYSSPASALANAGGCALRSGQYERAERDLRQALAQDPGNAYALAAMAESEYRQHRFFEARAFTERSLAAAPANPDVLQLASDIEERLGDKVAASRYVQRLRAEFPGAVTANPGDTTRP